MEQDEAIYVWMEQPTVYMIDIVRAAKKAGNRISFHISG
jgi:hypothetical protein